MNTPQPPQSDKIKSKATGGTISGVGVGTLLVLCAKRMPENSAIKDILLWAAPSVTAFCNMLWLWERNRLEHYFNRRDAERAAEYTERNVEDAMRRLREILQEAKEDGADDEEIERLREKIAELRARLAEWYANRVRIHIDNQ